MMATMTSHLGELDDLLAVGEAQALEGRFVDGPEVFRKLKERSKARRQAK
jgi:hypothetical protein